MITTPIIKPLPLIISGLVMIIAGSSFLLSYFNLRDTAIKAGIPEDLAFMWPLCLDAFLILSSLYIFRSNQEKRSTVIGWVTLIAFTVISVIFNIQNSTSAIAMATHAIPPVSLCISLELFMELIRGGVHQDRKPVAVITPDRSGDHDYATVVITTDQRSERADQVREYVIAHPEATNREVADHLGCSASTVSKYRKSIPVMGNTEEKDNEKIV